jgi:hypothetical protein
MHLNVRGDEKEGVIESMIKTAPKKTEPEVYHEEKGEKEEKGVFICIFMFMYIHIYIYIYI